MADSDRYLTIVTEDGKTHTFKLKKRLARDLQDQMNQDMPEGISDMEKGN